MAPHGVLLVTSDHLAWPGLEALLRRERDLRVLDSVRAADAAVRAANLHRPTSILVAADLEHTPLVVLVEALRARSPRSKVIVIGPALEHAEQARLLALRSVYHVRWEEMISERMGHILALVRDADVRVVSGVVAERLAPPDRRQRSREPGIALSERERA